MKAILVDDEALALEFLKNQLIKIGGIEIIGAYHHLNINDSSALLEEIDVIFLDIEMPGANGLELAEKILEINPEILVVFVTAYNKYAVKAFEINALDYVLKPIQLNRLKTTVKRVELKLNHHGNKNNRLNHSLRINVSRELSFEFIKDKKELIKWRTTKSQELFLYLLHYYNKTVRKSELIELLWPDFEQDKAYSQLYTTIYHIRKAINKYSNHFKIVNMGEGYVLHITNATIDLVEWEKKIKSTPPLNTETISSYEKIMSLYSGGYLQKYNYLWADIEQYRLEQLWIKKAYQIAGYYVRTENFEKAEESYVKIYMTRPEEEDAHFSLMKLYDSTGLGLLVNQQYQKLTKALDELNLQVSSNVSNWFSEYKKRRNY